MEARKPPRRRKHQPRGLLILHEDKHIIVVDKAPGLLTMGTDRNKTETAYYRLTDYVRKGNPKSRERIYIVHRLDREVSGILLFARSHEAKAALQEQWPQVEKRYLALVHGKPAQNEGVISSFLVESGVNKVHSTKDPNRGKLASTEYKVLGAVKGLTLLELRLHSGRKHQIRVHLSESGMPIAGDTRYGAPKSPFRRLALHAQSLSFRHPHTHERCEFETRTPYLFTGKPREAGERED